MKKISNIVKAVAVFAAALTLCVFAGCKDPVTDSETSGKRVNRGLGLNGGNQNVTLRGDEEWGQTVLYATDSPRSSMLSVGVTVTNGAPSFPSNRVNAAGYYPIGGINNSAGIKIHYDVVVSEDARVGLYAEFGNRNETRNFDECFTLTVNDQKIEVTDVTMPAYYDDYTPTNRFNFLNFIELKAESINRITLELTAEDKFGYNFYGYKFTSEKATVSLDQSSLVPRDEIIDKGYLKFAGEERVTINGANTLHIAINGSIETGAWAAVQGARRLYIKKNQAASTFTLTVDRTDIEDVSKVGLLLNHNIARTGAVLEYSTDNTNWTEFASFGDDSLKGDYAVRTDECEDSWMLSYAGGAFNDGNVYSCFFMIGKYFNENKVLYIRASYRSGGDAGCDWLGSYSIFDYLEITENAD